MANKRFTVRFYAGTVAQEVVDQDEDDADVTVTSKPSSIAQILASLTNPPFTIKDGGNVFFIKDLSMWNSGRNFKGVFGRLRMNDLPHIANATGFEEELDLADNEGLIEKNHFIYTEHRKLIIFQENFYAGTSDRVANYLTKYSGSTVSFSPIIKPDTLKRFMHGDVKLRKFDISVARPTNPGMFPSDNFSAGMLQLLSSSSAATLGIHMSANMPGMRGNSFLRKTKETIGKFVREGLAKHATVEVKEGDRTFEIDLLADQILTKRTVPMAGRYPDPAHIYQQLEDARKEVGKELDAHFGSDQKAIN